MLPKQDLAWWYWLSTIPFLTVGVMGETTGLIMVALLLTTQTVHYYVQANCHISFPVQVRLGFAIWFCLGLLPHMHWMLWVQLAGTSISVLIDYCAMARLVTLAPWNRTQRLSAKLVLKTFLSRPVRGSFLDVGGITQQ